MRCESDPVALDSPFRARDFLRRVLDESQPRPAMRRESQRVVRNGIHRNLRRFASSIFDAEILRGESDR
jgi:hypothetical protein